MNSILTCALIFNGILAGHVPSDYRMPGSPGESSLQCSICLPDKTVTNAVPFPCTVTFHNIGKIEMQFPIIPDGQVGKLQAYLMPDAPGPATNEIAVAHLFLNEETGKFFKAAKAKWYSLEPGESKSILLMIDAHHKLPPGNYQLRIDYEYRLRPIGPPGVYISHPSESTNDINRAKADGKFILDVKKVWTGISLSNVEKLIISSE